MQLSRDERCHPNLSPGNHCRPKRDKSFRFGQCGKMLFQLHPARRDACCSKLSPCSTSDLKAPRIKSNCRTLMLPLNQWGLPLAIILTVVFIVVHSSQSCAFWPFSHVVKKLQKSMPLGFNTNPSSAIVRILFALPLVTAIHHRMPRFECRSGSSVLRMSVNRKPNTHGFSVALLTLTGSTGKQLCAFNYLLRSALANRKAVSHSVLGWKIGNYFSLSKGSTGEQLSCRHGIGLFNVVFSGGRTAATVAHCD